jgi:parallel beta-helix repeat protein
MADKTTGKLKLWIAKITDKISDTINIYLSENFSKIDDEFSSLKDGVDEHKADDTKHITSTERTIWNNKLDASAYTAADILAKVKTVDGNGSGLDADLLDGAHAGNGPNNVLKLDSGGFVPLPNIPGTLTGKSADMVDGKHFSDIQNDAQAKVDTHANSKQTHGISSGYYIAKTSRSDQLPAWSDIQGKPDLALAADLAAHKADGSSHSKTARFVVGTSTAGWTEKDCDYLCDGTADQVEINAAITALPATGGEIVILDGTYNITSKINVTKNNVSIRGNGNATILKRMFNSTSAEGVITLTGRSGCKIANLQVDGNKASYTNDYSRGIYLSSSSNNTITGNTYNNNIYGMYIESSNNNNTVTGNTCNNNTHGIYLSSSSNNTITGNTCNNNTSNGISLLSSSNNTVTGNTCNNNSNGMYIESSNNNTVVGNTCNNNDRGMYIESSNNNTVVGNTCIRGTGQAGDYISTQYPIRLVGTSNNYNLISNNNCMGKAVASEGGTGNTLVNNKFDAE